MKFLQLIRWPNLLMLAFTQVLVRVGLMHGSLLDPSLGWLVLGTTAIAAGGYIINDYYDIKIDLINKPEAVIIGRVFTRRRALIFYILLNIIGLSAGFVLYWWVFGLNLFCMIWLWWYSNLLKRTAFWGNFSVALLAGLALVVVALHYHQHEQEVYLYAVFAGGITLIREIIKDLEDLRGDAQFGCRTLPIVWGILPTKRLLYGLMVCFMASLLVSNNDIKLVLIGLLPTMGLLAYWLYYADTANDFRRLSLFCKGIMFIGILTMML